MVVNKIISTTEPTEPAEKKSLNTLTHEIKGRVIIEIKSISTLGAIHQAQLLSYLRLSGCEVGLLINFNVKILKDGVCRMKL